MKFINSVRRKIQNLIRRNDDETPTENEVAILAQIIDRLNIRCASNTNITRREVTTIRHIQQADTWDCGLACIQMVTQWLKKNSFRATQDEQEEQRRWMIEFVKAKSLWSIDLISLLQYIIQHDDLNNLNTSNYLFCSNRFGAHEEYHNLDYYRDAFTEDERRVKDLFDVAEQQNLPLMQISHMSLNTLIDIVSRENVIAIALLDNSIFCDEDQSYSGHYVVLCGISKDKNNINMANMNSQQEDGTYNYCLVVKDPGICKETQFVTPSLFEKSWRAKGTDEDIVLIAKHLES